MKNLQNIDTWIFDLDETLYPFEHEVIKQIDDKIAKFCQDLFKVDVEEAHKIRATLCTEYGITLNGLVKDYNVDADYYLDYIHDVDYSSLKADTEIFDYISNLFGRKIIYTNSTIHHSNKVLKQLGLTDIFKDIFDINASAFKAKPCKNAFQDFVNLYAIKPSQSIMFDDKLPNIETAISYGLKGVHIHPEYNTKKLNQESTYAGFCDLKTLFKNFEHYEV